MSGGGDPPACRCIVSTGGAVVAGVPCLQRDPLPRFLVSRPAAWVGRCDPVTPIFAAAGGSDATLSSDAARRLTGSITALPMSDGAKRCARDEAAGRLLDVSIALCCA